ncbi:MAG: ABC transporter substrate-binding protein [Chloroflexi bacterium]|nr:ABC transporter substrate-binding protein [Chloroflexota bacterium]
MNNRRFIKLAGCFIVLALLTSACAPAAAPTAQAKATPPSAATKAPAATPAAKPAAPTAKPAAPAPTAKPAGEQPRYGGIFTIGTAGDPPSLDPHRESTAYTVVITGGTYNGLVKYDPHAWPAFKTVPDLATGWQLGPDGKAYTFNLVKGAKFHDGSPVTAEDAKYSFDRMRDPQLGLVRSPKRQELANIANIDAPDDSTVKITLKNPQASFLTSISAVFFAVMPKRVVLDKKGDMTKTILGSGPFKFKDYSQGVSFELVKNPDYFVKGRPYLDGVKGYIMSDTFTRFAALRTRNILWWSPFPYPTMSQAKVIEEQLSDKINFKWEFHPAWYGMIFNVNKAPWNDVRLRQAVTLSFDRKKMLSVGLEGAGVVGMSGQPPGEWALPEEEMNKVPGYTRPDIEAAKKLMAEAGFPNGLRAEAMVRSTGVHQAFATVTKDAVAAIGIALDLSVQDITVYDDRRFRKAFDISPGASGSASMDPDIVMGNHYVSGAGSNWAAYSNPTFDELFVKQSQTLDVAERKKMVWELQRILLKDVPIAVAYWSNTGYAWWKEVRNFTPAVSYFNAYDYQDIWLAR